MARSVGRDSAQAVIQTGVALVLGRIHVVQNMWEGRCPLSARGANIAIKINSYNLIDISTRSRKGVCDTRKGSFAQVSVRLGAGMLLGEMMACSNDGLGLSVHYATAYFSLHLTAVGGVV
jgi:hypothetical protein